MKCRQCGTAYSPDTVACRQCQVRIRPVRVEPYFVAPCPYHPWVSCGQAPVYRLCFPSTTPNEQLDALFEALLAWWPQVRSPVAWVLDYRKMDRIDDWTARGERFANFASKVKPHASGKVVCHAILARNELAMSALRTMFWRDSLQFPRRFFISEEEANSWVRKQVTFSGPATTAI